MSTLKKTTPSAKRRQPPLQSIPQVKRQKPVAPVESEHGFVVTPLLGAMLRVTHEALTDTILKTLKAQGIEMTETEFSVMRYPGPDGVRPIVLAQRCNMTKQAMNYVLAGLVAKGYVERRSLPGRRARMIFLTAKGWGILAVQRRCALEAEHAWAAHIGARRFDALRASLYELAVWLGKLEPPAAVTEGNPVPRKSDRRGTG